MSRWLAAALVVVVFAACGGESAPSSILKPSGSAPASPSESASVSPTVSPSESAASSAPVQKLTCDAAGPGWPSTALGKSADAETGTTAAAQALSAFVGGPGGNLPATGYRELYRSKELALYGQPDPGGEPDVLLVVTVRATDGIWAGEDAGQCRTRTWLGTKLGMAADWKLSVRTTQASRALKVLVTERACASGASAKGRIAKPRISYESDRVVITIGVKPLTGAQDCQANRATPLTVTLAEALGNRELFDGGPFPAAPVRQPK